MKTFGGVLTLLAIGATAVTAAFTAYGGGDALQLFFDMGFVSKIVLLWMLPLAATVILLGIAAAARRKRSGFLPVGGLIAGVLGLLGAAYGSLNIVLVVRRIGAMPSWHVMAPSIAEALSLLAVGLWVAAVAMVANGAAARTRKA